MKLILIKLIIFTSLTFSAHAKLNVEGLNLTNGKKLTNTEINSDIKIISFFFSSCETTCLLINSKLKKLSELIEHKKDVKIISITVDPEYDTIKRLSNYSKKWRNAEGQWLFATGKAPDVFKIIKNQFKLPGGGFAFVHSESVIILKDGKKEKTLSLLEKVDFNKIKSYLGLK